MPLGDSTCVFLRVRGEDNAMWTDLEGESAGEEDGHDPHGSQVGLRRHADQRDADAIGRRLDREHVYELLGHDLMRSRILRRARKSAGSKLRLAAKAGRTVVR